MNDLCDAMGIRSPSLYAAFGSKEALYLEAIDHYVGTIGPPVWDKLAEGSDRSRRRRETVARGDRKSARIPRDAGRLHGGAGGRQRRMAGRESPKSSGKSGSKCWACCGRGWKLAVANGELPPTTDIEGLSRFYLSVYQGMAVQARDGAGARELRGVVEAAMSTWPGGGRE